MNPKKPKRRKRTPNIGNGPIRLGRPVGPRKKLPAASNRAALHKPYD